MLRRVKRSERDVVIGDGTTEARAVILEEVENGYVVSIQINGHTHFVSHRQETRAWAAFAFNKQVRSTLREAAQDEDFIQNVEEVAPSFQVV